MAHPPRSTEECQTAVRRRFAWVTIGFWLGGIGLGTAGCILGASLPYRYPAAIALSVLWWGIYLGCFGASIGAVFGSLAERNPASPFKGSDSAGQSPTGAGHPAFQAGYHGFLNRAPRTALAVNISPTARTGEIYVSPGKT